MLKKLFGSSKVSARAASHAQFIYLSHDLQKVRAELSAFVLGDGGVALISGQHGIGKTFLLQLVANDLESGRSARRVVSLSCNFGFSGGDLVRRVCEKLGARHTASAAADEDSHLHRCLLEGMSKDGLTILLVDEAQNLGDAELERFLSLTDLHAGAAGNLRIVVAGRPGVEAAFTRAARRYRRRHVWHYRLQPLQRQEIAPFIAAWLRAQGRKRDNRLFTPESVEGIARRSSGVPGAIIDLCSTALLLAAENGRQPLSADDIDDAADYLQVDHQPSAPLVDDGELEEDDREIEAEVDVDVEDAQPPVEDAPPPPLLRAAPGRTDERVILPFAAEPARAEEPRRRFPAPARPASLEKALPKEPPKPKRAVPLEPVPLEPVSYERVSPRFTARDPEDMFVAGPRPSAMPMHDFRRRRGGGAGRIAVGIALAGLLLLLPVLWVKLTDRSPVEVATALLRLDSQLPDVGGADPSAPVPATTEGRGAGGAASSGEMSRPLAEAEAAPVPGARSAAPAVAAPEVAPPAPAQADASEPPPLPMARERPAAESRIAEAAPRQSEPPAPAAPTPMQDSKRAPAAITTPAEPRQATAPIPAPEQPAAEQPARVADAAPPPEPAEPAVAPAPAPAQPERPAEEPAAPVETAVAEPAPEAAGDGGETAPLSESNAAVPSGGQVATAAEAASPTAESAASVPNQATAEARAERQIEEQAAPAEPDPIQALLAQARGQIERYALTTPKGDNALETYQQVLQLAPGHPQALQGIRDVAEMYIRLASAAERSGDITRMQRYREKAAEIAPDHPMVLALQRTRKQAAEAPSGAPQPAAQLSMSEAPPPEDRAGRAAAASEIIKRLQERFGVTETAPQATAPAPPRNVAATIPEPRQTAVQAVRQPAQPPRATSRQPSGPISLAAFNQSGGIEKAIAEGRDVNTRFSDGRTPLIIAAARGESDHVKLLLANGAEPNAATGDAATALMYAAWNGDVASTEALLQHGANPNARNLDGKTALMAAATNGHTAAAEALLRHGGAVDAQASNGWTALMYAAWTGKVDVARVLLEHDANPAITNGDGDTAADLAAERGYAALADMLSGRRVIGGRSAPGVRTANRSDAAPR